MTRQTSTFLDVLSEYVLRRNVLYFTRQQLLEDDTFMTSVTEYVTTSNTPDQQVSLLLQNVRDLGVIDFVDYDGTYRVKNTLT